MKRAPLDVLTEGAHVTRWAPDGFGDVLWCSPIRLAGKPLRGGIPVCWPWFGPHPTDPSRPQHGYARLATWQPVDSPYDRVVGERKHKLELTAEGSRSGSPEYALDAMLVVEQFHDALRINFVTTNTGKTAAPVTLALHTYFAVSDVAAVSIEGLDGARYRDNTRGGAWTTQNGPMRIAGETIALFDDAPSRQTIIDPGFGRRIDIHRVGAGSTIVWNPGANAATMPDIPPGEAQRFLCIESGCIGERAITLEAGQDHVLTVNLTVSKHQ